MNIQQRLPILFFLLFTAVLSAQTKTSAFLKELLEEKASPQLRALLQQPDTFRYQLIYTRIDRNRKNKPLFTNYYYNVNKDDYFNPASTVKMPLAFMALEKINQLRAYGISKETTMFTDSAFSGQTKVLTDSSAANHLPSVAQYIKKIFLVSDNDAYNRLYEFVGQETINRELWKRGYVNSRITRRFVPMSEEENRHTNPIRFEQDGKILYQQPAAYSTLQFNFSKPILIGQGHYNWQDEYIAQPMDFTKHNALPLEDLQQILQSVLFPASVDKKKRFALTEEDYRFLYQYMSELPSESVYPKYDTAEYYDSYTKFFFFKSGKQKIPASIRIYNKAGWSYGFLTDVAYIVDFKNNVEFMLSGVIYVNKDNVLNDNKYEYDETGYPFFREVGTIIYQYELNRKRKHKPDLTRFKLTYDK
jgi:hypothetical protein